MRRRRHTGRGRDTACIVWTSGTTGAPKGAVYDHAADGGDLPQHRRAHLSRRPPPRRAALRPRRLHDTDVGRAGERDDDRDRRASRGRRRRRCGSSATRTSRWRRASRRSGNSSSTHADFARTDFSGLRVCRDRWRHDLARPRAPHARDPGLSGDHALHEHRGRGHHEHRVDDPTRSSPHGRPARARGRVAHRRPRQRPRVPTARSARSSAARRR